jgi:hypothetical protein
MMPIKSVTRFDETSNKIQKSRLTMEYTIIENYEKAELRQLEIERKAFQREIKNDMKRIINRFNTRIARHSNLVQSIDYKELISKKLNQRSQSIPLPHENKSYSSFECSTFRPNVFLTEQPHNDVEFNDQVANIEKITKENFESSIDKTDFEKDLHKVANHQKQKIMKKNFPRETPFTGMPALNSMSSFQSSKTRKVIAHQDIDQFFEQLKSASVSVIKPSDDRVTYSGYDSYISLNKFNTAFNTPSTLVSRSDAKLDKRLLSNDKFQNPFDSLDFPKKGEVKQRGVEENLITSALLKERLVKAKPYFPYVLKESIQDKKMFERITNAHKIRNLTIKSVQF